MIRHDLSLSHAWLGPWSRWTKHNMGQGIECKPVDRGLILMHPLDDFIETAASSRHRNRFRKKQNKLCLGYEDLPLNGQIQRNYKRKHKQAPLMPPSSKTVLRNMQVGLVIEFELCEKGSLSGPGVGFSTTYTVKSQQAHCRKARG